MDKQQRVKLIIAGAVIAVLAIVVIYINLPESSSPPTEVAPALSEQVQEENRKMAEQQTPEVPQQQEPPRPITGGTARPG